MKSMKYDVARTIIQASKLQRVFTFLDIFLANIIALKFSSKMMYVSKEIFHQEISTTGNKRPKRPVYFETEVVSYNDKSYEEKFMINILYDISVYDGQRVLQKYPYDRIGISMSISGSTKWKYYLTSS